LDIHIGLFTGCRVDRFRYKTNTKTINEPGGIFRETASILDLFSCTEIKYTVLTFVNDLEKDTGKQAFHVYIIGVSEC